jgi:hypothetical protein
VPFHVYFQANDKESCISFPLEYLYSETRQTIQVGSGNLHVGKLNQMPQEKNISK